MPQAKKFNKVPVNLPVGNTKGTLDIGMQKVYIGYLWFKSLSTSDRLYKRDLKPYKNKAYYWGKKLASAGLIEELGDHFRIKAYEVVWKQLKIAKVKRKSGRDYRFTKLDILPNDFLKDGVATLQQFLVRRKKRQIRNVLSTSNSRTEQKLLDFKSVRFGCVKVAKTLGYSSASLATGSKYRDKYFRVLKQPRIRDWREGSDGNFRWRFDCDLVNLRLD